MKKLSKVYLREFAAVELGKDQMKNILGGSFVNGCNDKACSGSCSVNINGVTHSGKCNGSSSACGCKLV